MKSIIYFVLLTCSTLLIVSSNHVIDLTEYSIEEFNSELENYDTIFVKFFEPSCQFCRALGPVFSSAARKMKSDENDITFAEVDCSRPPEGIRICRKYNIRAFPVMQLFKGGKFYKEYTGNRDTKSMVTWLKSYAIDESLKVNSFNHLESIISANTLDNVMVIGVFRSYRSKAYSKWAKEIKKVSECRISPNGSRTIEKVKRQRKEIIFHGLYS